MNDALGLSIGTTNLVAVRNGNAPVTRRAVLTLLPHRRPEIGVPAENPNLTEPGTVMSGFVERVGDPDTLTSADRSERDPGLLLVEALDAMVYAADAATASANITIAVPAYWRPGSLRALRDALRTHADFVRSGVAPRLVSDAVAALTEVNSNVGLPERGVVGLLDFGGGGTTITLADAASGFQPIDEPLRYREFSGAWIDEAVLVHLLDDLGHAGNVDLGATAAVGPFARLREECRRAKERLSTEAEVELTADLPGNRSCVRVTRVELENLIADRLSGVIGVLDDVLARHRIASTNLAAVAAVGGSASIPLVAQRLSSHMRAPVVTAAQPALSMAIGATLFVPGESGTELQMPTAMATMAEPDGTTGVAGLPTDDLLADDLFADDAFPGETFAGNISASTEHELAWSQVDDAGDEPGAYTDEPYETGSIGRPVRYGPATEPPPGRPRGRPRITQLAVGLSALVAMIGVGGVAYTLTNTRHEAPRAPTITTAVPPPPPSSHAPSPSPTAPPPPSVAPTTSAPAPPPPVTTTYQPPQTTTTTSPPMTTTTTSATTTTMTTPSTTTTTVPTTTAPTTAPSTTVTTPMTTEYLTIPFVPMPIPVQVPQNGG